MHKAIIARIDKVEQIPGADRIHLAYVLGESVVVSKDVGVGYIGVLFPAELQLSEQYCFENNLLRDSSKNKDTTKAGFFDNNRRVRVQPFLKVKSQAYFAGLESLVFTGESAFPIGMQFDEIKGIQICQKYISEKAKTAMANGNTKQAKAVLYPTFAKHVDSDQFKHFVSTIKPGSLISFHAKVHGTSARMGYVKKAVQLKWYQKLFNKFGANIPEFVYDYVVGTRNVVIENESKEGFHGSEGFRFEVMESIKPFLKPGMVVYGEISGFANTRPIMTPGNVKALKDKRYTEKYGDTCVFKYGCKDHEYRFHIYRITRESVNGDVVDMSEKQVEKWASDRNLLATFEVYPQQVYDGNENQLRSIVEHLTERPNYLTEDYIDPTHISEGIILRVDLDGDTPKFFKNKSYAFRVLEGMLEVDDMETLS